MNDSIDRDTFRQDRLPDVLPARTAGHYTEINNSSSGYSSEQVIGQPIVEPAWWEVDEVASLPDARRWRAGSIISSHLPLSLRTALDSTDQRQGSWVSSRSAPGDLESILGGSRFGPGDAVPVWTDADTIRDRSSWKDDPSADGGGRRQKRGKRNRQERPSERRRDHGPQ